MRLLPFAVLATLALPSAVAQNTNCDTFITSQQEVDAFDCTSLSSLRLSGPGITNLDGLSELVTVGGDVSIVNAVALTSVDGLAALTSVGRNLSLFGTDALTNVDGLAMLSSIGGNLTIQDNAELSNVDGLSALDAIGGFLTIQDNGALADVDGLAALGSIGGNLQVTRNATLKDLNGFAALTSIGGNLSLQGNAALADVDGLGALGSVGNNLYLRQNDVLANVDGLAGLTSISSGVSIENNAALANLNGLAEVASIGGDVSIRDNAELSNVDGLAALDAIGGFLSLFGNDALANVDGLSSLASVGDYVELFENDVLADVDGFSALSSIGGSLRVTRNRALTSVDGFAGLASIGGSSGFGISVRDNYVLRRCDVGLGPILTADAADDSTIQDGNGGDAETNVFSGNDPTGFCNSEQEILDTYVAPPAGSLPLINVTLLRGTCPDPLPAGRATCRVRATATFTADQGQRFTVFLRVAETGRIAFRGEIKPRSGQTTSAALKFKTIGTDPARFTLELVIDSGSVAAPTAAAEVQATLAMTKGGALARASEPLSAYPNPATDAATLRFAVSEAGEATLVVYDALGREVARPVDGPVEGAVVAEFDAAGLSPGLYVARLTTARGTETVRLTVAR